MDKQVYNKISTLLEEIKTLLESEMKQPLVWWQSISTGIWWVSTEKDNVNNALYSVGSDISPTYFINGKEADQELYSDIKIPLEAKIGIILLHAKLNNIEVPPFPWHKL